MFKNLARSKLFQSVLAFVILATGATALSGYRAAAHNETNNSNSSSDTAQHVQIMVMNHLCNANIKTLQDFQNLEAGKDPVAALANTVLNCPTTGLVGNDPVAGTVASPRTTYDFTVTGENSNSQNLSNATYQPHKLCESDINVDVNNDGIISPTTCLDISHYMFSDVSTAHGKVDVTEINPPAGYHFGTLRFTPPALDGNNDMQSFLATDDAKGLIKLDVSNDKDKMVMLHVYNFQNSGGTNGSSNSQIIQQIQNDQTQINQLQNQITQLINQLH